MIDEKETVIIRQIFEMRAAGESLGQYPSGYTKTELYLQVAAPDGAGK